MNITKIKELEDLKIKKNDVSYLIGQKMNQMVRDKLETSMNEFIEFFNNQKFEISKKQSCDQGTVITANYNGFKVLLTIPDASQRFMDCISAMHLFIPRSKKKSYEIVLKKEERPEMLKEAVDQVQQVHDLVDGDIKKAKEEIQSISNQINYFSPADYYFSFENERYQDLNEILISIFFK